MKSKRPVVVALLALLLALSTKGAQAQWTADDIDADFVMDIDTFGDSSYYAIGGSLQDQTQWAWASWDSSSTASTNSVHVRVYRTIQATNAGDGMAFVTPKCSLSGYTGTGGYAYSRADAADWYQVRSTQNDTTYSLEEYGPTILSFNPLGPHTISIHLRVRASQSCSSYARADGWFAIDFPGGS